MLVRTLRLVSKYISRQGSGERTILLVMVSQVYVGGEELCGFRYVSVQKPDSSPCLLPTCLRICLVYVEESGNIEAASWCLHKTCCLG